MDEHNWNLGGDRIWLAPELQYNVLDRNNFFESYCLPQQIDPGNYNLKKVNLKECVLTQEMLLDLNYESQRKKQLQIKRKIRGIRNPLLKLSVYSKENIKETPFIGFEHSVTLTETENDGVLSEAWNLTQLNPGGRLFVSSLPYVEYNDYYIPIDENYQTINGNYIDLKVTGDRMYKVGYNSTCVLGRLAYLNQLKDGNYYLLIRNFFNNPSAAYTKEPASLVGANGSSVHIYNDDGELGGFGELECSGQPIGGHTDRSTSTDQITTWLYFGRLDMMKSILLYLMGIHL